MSSEKQLILIILVAVVVFGYQFIKDEKKKNDYCCTNQLKDSIENTFKMWGY